MFTSPLFFTPIPVERIWGGRNLEQKLGRSLPPGKPIGESWEVVDRPEACSVVEGGPLAGKTIRQAIEEHAASLLGPGWDPKRQFPILVKWLDCRERLSLQVHPPAAVAPELKGEPKTEMWYVAEAEARAGVYAGFKAGVTREQFHEALKSETAEGCVARRPMAKGDSLFVPSGRIHAIDGGNLILEIQQNSDTTYRVYDWGRKDASGKPRALHIEESIKSIDFADFEPEPLRGVTVARLGGVIAECREFRVRRWILDSSDAPLSLPAKESARLLHVVEGAVVLRSESGETTRVTAGRQTLLPWAGAFTVSADPSTVFLLSDKFA